ncbi:hypothetical protein [Streptomyces puniciscabiei]|nr:hypothetical protein [Streptomyces puniciscabiei]
MRVDHEGVSNCARCHRSDWSRRFPFPEPDPHRAQQEARRAELNALFSDWLSRNKQSTRDKTPEPITLPPPRRPEMKRERLVEHVPDRKPTESNTAQDTKNRVRKSLLGYGGLLVGLVAWFAIVAGVADGDQVKAASAKPTASPGVSARPSVKSSVPPSPSQQPAPTEPVRDYQDWDLAKAVADAHKRHARSVTYTDLSDLNRSPVHLGNWKVCSQWPDAGANSTGTVTFAVLKTNEACAWPPLPDSGHDSSSNGSSGSSSGGSTSTSAGSPASGSSTTTQLCSIRSNAGNCYHAGQFCRRIDVGATTTDAAGREITCDYEAGANRWHY